MKILFINPFRFIDLLKNYQKDFTFATFFDLTIKNNEFFYQNKSLKNFDLILIGRIKLMIVVTSRITLF